MNNKISTGDFLDLSDFKFADIFENTTLPWEVITKISDYVKAKLTEDNPPANFTKNNNVLIGKGTIIEEGAVIKDGAIIGENCTIGSAVLIRGNCIIGDNVQLGHGIELKHSLILNNSAIAHLNYVGDSVVGNDVNISGGAIVANLRLDKSEISVNIAGEKIKTGLEKFGAVIGDGSTVGVNAVLNPGTVLGKNCVIYPLTSVRGFHNANEIIK